MKKILIVFMLTITFFVTGCTSSNLKLVKDNMSEIAYVSYSKNTDDFYCDVTYGERENNYTLDGTSYKNVKYCLVSLYLQDTSLNYVNLQLSINGEIFDCELERNPFTLCYMTDLERKLSGDEEIKVTWNETEYTLEKMTFECDYQKALEIACEEYKDVISGYTSNGKLNAECYLKLLGMKQTGYDNVYWCFTILDKNNNTHICLIDTNSGEIVMKDE